MSKGNCCCDVMITVGSSEFHSQTCGSKSSNGNDGRGNLPSGNDGGDGDTKSPNGCGTASGASGSCTITQKTADGKVSIQVNGCGSTSIEVKAPADTTPIEVKITFDNGATLDTNTIAASKGEVVKGQHHPNLPRAGTLLSFRILNIVSAWGTFDDMTPAQKAELQLYVGPSRADMVAACEKVRQACLDPHTTHCCVAKMERFLLCPDASIVGPPTQMVFSRADKPAADAYRHQLDAAFAYIAKRQKDKGC